MARGNEIIVSANPRGVFMEGAIGTGLTPKPGTIMQIDPSVSLVGGRHTFVLYNADADGGRPKGPLYVLLEDSLQGKTTTDAYAAGERGRFYTPVAGEELNLLLTDENTGTSDNDVAIGTTLIIDDGTGKMIATTGSPETEVAMTLEAVSNMSADQLVWCAWTGY